MGVAKDIEKRLEGLMEGFFTKVFRSGLQPVEVGRRILREMEENRTVSVNRTYAPNDFQVFIGPEDYERFEPMEAGLVREFSELVIDKAKERRFNLMGLPRIAFIKEEKLGQRRVPSRGRARRRPRPTGPAGVHARTEFGGGRATRLGRSAATLPNGWGWSSRRGRSSIVLDEEGGARERISVTSSPITIGRLSTNDVVISDSNVSRRHAELKQEGGSWKLVDLGSTNGTLVNGKLGQEHTIRNGDRISFGTSELEFSAGAAH